MRAGIGAIAVAGLAAFAVGVPAAGAATKDHFSIQAEQQCAAAAQSHKVFTKAEAGECKHGAIEEAETCPHSKVTVVIVAEGNPVVDYALRVGAKPVRLSSTFTITAVYKACPKVAAGSTTTTATSAATPAVVAARGCQAVPAVQHAYWTDDQDQAWVTFTQPTNPDWAEVGELATLGAPYTAIATAARGVLSYHADSPINEAGFIGNLVGACTAADLG